MQPKNDLLNESILFTLFNRKKIKKDMAKGFPVIGIGSIVFIFGLIFDLQGQSIVGPESSFMYANPDWITYGIQIMILGITIIGVGTLLKIFKK